MYVYIICQYCNYPRGKDDTLEPLKDRFASNGGIHTTEVEHWVVDGGGAVIKWLYDEAEPCIHTDTQTHRHTHTHTHTHAHMVTVCTYTWWSLLENKKQLISY